MRKLWKYLVDAEPVALFSALATLVPLVANGLVVFNAWGPTADQLAYVNGATVVVAGALGVTGARRLVTPTSRL
jgi:hypothetical protein